MGREEFWTAAASEARRRFGKKVTLTLFRQKRCRRFVPVFASLRLGRLPAHSKSCRRMPRLFRQLLV